MRNKIIKTVSLGGLLFFPIVAMAAISIPSEASGLPNAGVDDILANILDWLLGIFAVLGIIGFIVSGIMYLISAGDDDMISKAKKGMQYSIYGVIVGLAGFVIIQAVDLMLNAQGNF